MNSHPKPHQMRPALPLIYAVAFTTQLACANTPVTPDIVDVWVDTKSETKELGVEKFGESLVLKYKGATCPVQEKGAGMTAFVRDKEIPLLYDANGDQILFDGESYRRKKNANKTKVLGAWKQADEQGRLQPNGKGITIHQHDNGNYYVLGYLKDKSAVLHYEDGKGLSIRERKDYYNEWIVEEVRLEQLGGITLLVIEGWSEGENWVYRYRKP